MQEVKEAKLRVSDASTNDLEFDSEDEDHHAKFLGFYNYVNEAAFMFTPVPEENVLRYETLKERLETIYELLNEEIHPVNIRDEVTISPCSINLSCVSFSRISLRRSTSKD